MRVTAEIYDEFAPGQPAIERELIRIREICASAANDLSDPMQDALLVALNRRRKELDELQGLEDRRATDPQLAAFLQPTLQSATACLSPP
jgi:hypothetical protein